MKPHIGKYVVERVLGVGGFGEVHLALDPDLQKWVAIKTLRARAGGPESDPLAQNRLLFTKEARETRKLSHPNVVTLHGFGVDEQDRTPYLVMEFLEGVTLQQLIASRA